jgi:hypothetical protein
MSIYSEFIDRIVLFQSEYGISDTKFSREIGKWPSFLREIKGRGSVTTKTIEQCDAWMNCYADEKGKAA